ncbi:WD40 repeat-like protein [Atractiella rhizophila]|nr:WD40 repeat-like protein [Atractiella rhizophila]
MPLLSSLTGVTVLFGSSETGLLCVEVVLAVNLQDDQDCLEELLLFESEIKTENFRAIACSVNPDTLDPLIAVGGDDRKIYIVHATAGTQLLYLGGHGGEVMDLKFSPSHPHLLASCGFDNQILLWDISIPPTRQQKRSRSTRSQEATGLPPPGQLVAIFSGAGGHSAPVLSLDWHSSLPLMLSGASDGAVKIWKVDEYLLKTYEQRREQKDKKPTERDAPLVQFPWWSTRNVHTIRIRRGWV